MMPELCVIVLVSIGILDTSVVAFRTTNYHTMLFDFTRFMDAQITGKDIKPIDTQRCKFFAIRGYIKEKCLQPDGKWLIKCHKSDHFYAMVRRQCRRQEFTNVCPDDRSFYQSCGHSTCPSDPETLSPGVGVCGEMVCKRRILNFLKKMETIVSNVVRVIGMNFRCDNDTTCANTIDGTPVDEFGCEEVNLKYFSCLPCMSMELNGSHRNRFDFSVPMGLVCDMACDCENCYDEANCKNRTYGMICRGNDFSSLYCDSSALNYIEPTWICDGIKHCKDGRDEIGCSSTDKCSSNGIPRLGAIGPQRRLHPRSKCSTPNWKRPYMRVCADFRDQMNCTDSPISPLLCNIRGHPTTISEHLICKSMGICDDKSDDWCLVLNHNCLIHKHRICDGFSDCKDNTDEGKYHCHSVTDSNIGCVRKFSYSRNQTAIPMSWVMDGEEDCVNGVDENASKWHKKCGTGDIFQYSFNQPVSCEHSIHLKCPNSNNNLELNSVCSQFSNCDELVCAESRRNYRIFNMISSKDKHVKRLFHCFPGLDSLRKTFGPCEKIPLKKNAEIYGVHDAVVLSSRQYAKSVNCYDMFGENYLYLACTNQCQQDVTCPLIPLSHFDCVNYGENKVLTIGDDEKLTVAFREADGSFQQNVFGCKNGLCVEYHKVCDLHDDCGDASDEVNCFNHFKCTGTGEYIPKSRKCDGIFDCLDFSDECNDHCDNQVKIFTNSTVYYVTCLLGLITVILNIVVLKNGLTNYSNLKTGIAMVNESFVLVVSSGDLLQGVFIFLVAISDEYLNDSTCKTQFRWTTSDMCTALGVISTMGSLVSLYSMTILSALRASGIKRMKRPKESLSKKERLILYFGIPATYVVSATVALVPTIETLESYFVQTYKYEANPLFVGGLNKERHIRIIKAYYGRLSRINMPWEGIERLVNDMFIYRKVTANKVGFYGSNGFCLFNYFVTRDDPQIWISGIVILGNIICVFIIAASYLSIHLAAMKSSNIHRGARNDAVVKRNRAVQRKISVLIITDILSWVPFFLLWCIHLSGLFDSTKWHSVFSILILPINSLINPILILENSFDSFQEKCAKLRQWFCRQHRIGGQNIEPENNQESVMTEKRDISFVA